MTDHLDLEAIPVEVACDRCEGDGAYSKLADCTTGGPDCACNGGRILVDPCEHCGGSGFDTAKCVALISEVERLQPVEKALRWIAANDDGGSGRVARDALGLSLSESPTETKGESG